jgi:hypothetical protein
MNFKDKPAVGEASQGGIAGADPEATGTFERSEMLDLMPGTPANDATASSAASAPSGVAADVPPSDDIECSLELANPPVGGWVIQGQRQRLLLWRLCWWRN